MLLSRFGIGWLNSFPTCLLITLTIALQGNLDAQKPGKKKRVRKPVIHLVTNDPMSSSPENNSSTEHSNSGQQNGLATAISDAAGFRHPRNPPRQAKSLVAKENYLN